MDSHKMPPREVVAVSSLSLILKWHDARSFFPLTLFRLDVRYVSV